METILQSQHPETEEAVRAATGKGWEEWFAVLDAKGGPALGRRAINVFLYDECKVDAWWATTLMSHYEAARGVLDKDGRPKGYMICATKTIAAPVEKVYSLWASGEALSRWFGADTVAEVVDGGTYRNADGDRGTFKRVRANKDLRFTWENPNHAPSLVDVVFQDKGKGKTGVMVTHDRLQGRPEADGLRAAWGAALDRLKALAES